jgi:ActR/RegA family two-component response regulator
VSQNEAGYRYTLIVGPDSPDRAWLESVLMRGGLEVAACTEEELLAMPDIVPPQIVVLDDSSRREQRMASFSNLRAHTALVGTPIVVLAYDADIDSFSGAITRGAAAYLAKPVPPEEIVSVVHKITGWLSSVDRTEKRRRVRRPLLMRVDVAVDGRDGAVAGQMIDVSAKGCRVELPWALGEGAAVRLTLYGLEGSTDLTLGGAVRWHRPVPGGAHVAGIRFTGTSAVLASRLLGTLTARS